MVRQREKTWGGQDDDYGGNLTQLSLIVGYCFLAVFIPLMCDYGGCSFVDGFLSLPKLMTHVPAPSVYGFTFWAAWVLLNIILWYAVPGKIVTGDPTPGGHETVFKCGALNTWFVVAIVFGLSAYYNILPMAEVVERYAEIGVASFIIAMIGSVALIFKGVYFPTVAADSMRHRNFLQDFFLGLEIQPKAFGINLKLFWIGRVGMLLWTVLGFCHARYQYEKIGMVTYSMMVEWTLAAIYTVDWAWKEEWYIRTIDMHHDRLGFYLFGGILVAFPTIYCAPTYYLAHMGTAEDDISFYRAVSVIVLYTVFYTLFRLCNDEKDYVRNQWKNGVSEDKLLGMFGKKMPVIVAKYRTKDKEHETILLSGGLWGITRHLNYTCDLAMTSCYSLVLPWHTIYPHIYLFHMIHLLITRADRDHDKCCVKYGKFWDMYIKAVPYKLLPGIY